MDARRRRPACPPASNPPQADPPAGRPYPITKPLVLSGSHEPLIFRRRAGYAGADEAERFRREHGEAAVRGLAARGVTWVRTHFFKGFGLAAERDEIEMTRAFAALCHKHGLKVELYTQFGTLQYETFLAEVPDMLSWCAVNAEDKHVTISYGHHDFRYEPCLVRDGYWQYLKEVIRLGIEHVGGDGFGFDNIANPTEPAACHCPECRQAFVGFLKSRYPTDTEAGWRLATERFGFAVLDHMLPPTFNRWCPAATYRVLKNPVFQEWAEFRAEILRRRIEEIAGTVKGLKPDALVEINAYRPFGANGVWWAGTDMHRLAPYIDAFWDERPPRAPEFRGDGLFWHRVHGYKLAQACDAVVFQFHGGRDAEQRKLAVAECLAFNRGHIGGLGRTVSVAEGHFAEADAFIAFRRDHAELFDNTESAAEAALFESVTSLTNNSIDPHYAEILAMNSLLAGHLPFDLVARLSADHLVRYALLVLPDVECLGEDEAQVIMDYVRGGGGVILTGRTSLYDSWRRRRPEPALAPMLRAARGFENLRYGREAGENTNVAQTEGAGMVLRGAFGAGRFAYVSDLEPVKPFSYAPDELELDTSYWHLPRNWAAFIRAARWAGAQRLTLAISGPPYLAVEARRTADGRLILHFVNYALSKSAQRVGLSLKGLKPKAARLWTPWEAKPCRLSLTKGRAGVSLAVGAVARYAVVELASPAVPGRQASVTPWGERPK